MTPRNDKQQPHGYWELYYYNGDTFNKCYYINGRRVGYEEYHNNNLVITSFHI